MDREVIEQKLEAFIRSEYLSDPDLPLSADTPLLSDGIIDSFSLVSLREFIRKQFGADIPPQRMNARTFDRIAQMTDLILAQLRNGA